MAQQSFLENNLKSNLERSAPLARRLRPRSLDEFVGQEHIVGEGKILRRLIAADRLSSVIFYGPPGTGKTSLAKIIAATTKSNFYELNAVTSGKKDIQNVLDEAKKSLSLTGKRTILFIDEIHRFNKAQQDLLLPSVEEGLIILIGATTENPLFEINSPLISRSTLFEFEALGEEELRKLLDRAVSSEQGLGGENVILTDEARDHLINSSGGDVRRALNAIELAYLTQPRDENGRIIINVDVASECIQKKAVRYDKSGDSHYDTISAFIKSVRGSDPDGALFWLAKMLRAGEDPKFIARRLVILASEDIGNAEPQALPLAVAAAEAVNMIGMPEARINLAQATTFLASAPKSNASYTGLSQAQDALEHSNGMVPGNLMNLTVPGSKKEREGREYVYPHDYAYNYYRQQYLPDDVDGDRFYFPTDNGYEKTIKERLLFLETIGDKSE